MDKEMVLTKLESLRRCLERIEAQQIRSLQDLQENLDKQDITVLNLERAIQLCVDIAAHLLADSGATVPDTMAGTFKSLSLQGVLDKNLAEKLGKSVGFRNIAIHQYQDINYEILYVVVTEHLQDFRNFTQAVLAQIEL